MTTFGYYEGKTRHLACLHVQCVLIVGQSEERRKEFTFSVNVNWPGHVPPEEVA